MPGATLTGTFGGSVVLDSNELSTLLRSEQGPVFRQLSRAGDVLKDGAKSRVGVWEPAPGEPDWSIRRRLTKGGPKGKGRRPGTLHDSIVKRVVQGGPGGFTILVGSEDEIALYHHEGTVPHTIVPVNAPQLVFWSGARGEVVRTPVGVRHPGTRPNRFLTDSLDDIKRMF